MLHTDAVTRQLLELLSRLERIPELKETRLAGGTALAMQIGHRISVDIDLFGQIRGDAHTLFRRISELGNVAEIAQSENIRTWSIDDIKVDIVNYPHPWIAPVVNLEGHRVSGIPDIAAMKLAAIAGRGSKKDFIDIHFLLEQFTLEQLLEFYEKKFTTGSRYIVLKSLTWFEDAEPDVSPRMLQEAPWEQVKERILAAVSQTAG